MICETDLNKSGNKNKMKTQQGALTQVQVTSLTFQAEPRLPPQASWGSFSSLLNLACH